MKFYEEEFIGYTIFQESQIEKKIRGFKELQGGWHFGEGIPPSARTVNEALRIADEGELWDFEIDAFPGVEGEILVTLYFEDKCLEFTIEPDSSITFVREESNVEVSFEENITLAPALQYILELGQLWNTSESSTKGILIEEGEGLQAWRSKTPVMVQGYQLFPTIVSSLSGPVFVDTSASTTLAWPQSPQSFGDSFLANYPLDAE